MSSKSWYIPIVSLVVLVCLVMVACTSATPTPAPTAVPTPTPAAAPVPTPIPTQTPIPTATPVPSPTPMPTPTPIPLASYFEGVTGIVDPTNFDWPREVEGLNGLVTIPSKPLRLVTASVGHDEIAVSLIPLSRLVGVGDPTKNATFSNVASLVQDLPVVTRDPETIIALSPDVVVTSPFFPADGIDALARLNIPVVQTDLVQGPEERKDNILLMGYILGEEMRAIEFAAEIGERFDSLVALTSTRTPKPRVVALTRYSDSIWTAGADSTEGGVITAAGGINAAEEAGIVANATTSLEGVIAMSPDIVIIPQPAEYGADEFRQALLDNEALAEVPAIRNGRVHIVESKHFTTLSHWNILGAEELARLLWPDLFTEPIDYGFSLPE